MTGALQSGARHSLLPEITYFADLSAPPDSHLLTPASTQPRESNETSALILAIKLSQTPCLYKAVTFCSNSAVRT